MQENHIIDVLHLKKNFGAHEVLKDITISFDNEPAAIIGQNGAGKTTFVKLLKGLLKPDSGEITIMGTNTKDATVAELAKHIGLVFQNPNDQIFKNKVLDEVMFGPLNIGQDMEKLEPQSRFKIVDFIEKYGDNVNLKCIIVLDTSGSMRDKPHLAKKSIMELLENLQERKGNSSIAVITYPGENEAMCSLTCGFTSEIDILRQKLESIRPGGGTPTGPAILKACELIYEYYNMQEKGEEPEYDVKKYYV
jgi:ABC-type iron transport system FetAB ATPase subunit